MIFCHFLKHEVRTLFGGDEEAGCIQLYGSPGIELYQQAVVIGHLFEMGYEPLFIGTVSAEAAFNQIVHTATLHLFKTKACHGLSFLVVVNGSDVHKC